MTLNGTCWCYATSPMVLHNIGYRRSCQCIMLHVAHVVCIVVLRQLQQPPTSKCLLCDTTPSTKFFYGLCL